VQIVGRPFKEAAILRPGDAFQRATEWHAKVLRSKRLPRRFWSRPALILDADGGHDFFRAARRFFGAGLVT
jgi:hypothetical protein